MALSIMSMGCQDELKKELFNVNTRVLALENEVQDKQQMNSRQYVSSSSRTSKVEEDLKKIKGEMDRLQIGIQKGEIPGMDDGEPSIAKQVASLREKVTELEQRVQEFEKSQKEILTVLEKIDKKKVQSPGSQKTKLTNAKAFERAFHSKHYRDIVESAPNFIANKHNKDRDLVRYYYSESLFKTGNTKEAAVSFGDLIQKFQGGDKAPKVRLRLGDCFRILGDKKTALEYYKILVEKYPKASESLEAHNHIKKLEAH